MNIRRATSRDTPDYVRMRAALWPDAEPDDLAAEMDGLLTDPSQLALLAETDDGRVCGFAEARVRAFANGVDEQPCAFLEGWWVDEPQRRAGVGRALIAAVEDWARGLGFSELGSDADLHNTLGQQAHQALGFEERERVIYYRKRLR